MWNASGREDRQRQQRRLNRPTETSDARVELAPVCATSNAPRGQAQPRQTASGEQVARILPDGSGMESSDRAGLRARSSRRRSIRSGPTIARWDVRRRECRKDARSDQPSVPERERARKRSEHDGEREVEPHENGDPSRQPAAAEAHVWRRRRSRRAHARSASRAARKRSRHTSRMPRSARRDMILAATTPASTPTKNAAEPEPSRKSERTITIRYRSPTARSVATLSPTTANAPATSQRFPARRTSGSRDAEPRRPARGRHMRHRALVHLGRLPDRRRDRSARANSVDADRAADDDPLCRRHRRRRAFERLRATEPRALGPGRL